MTHKLSQPIILPTGEQMTIGDALATGKLELGMHEEHVTKRDRWHCCRECPHSKTVYKAMIPGTTQFYPIGKLAYQSRSGQKISI